MIRKIRNIAILLLFALIGIQYYMMHHHYVPSQLKRVYITIPNLPDEFDGLTIGHLSDIHCGNFKDERELKEGIELLMRQAPDVVFITGDIIERYVEEMQRYAHLLSKIKAKEGVFCTLGNHEYGPTHLHKARDAKHIEEIKAVEQSLKWELLLNENRILKRGDKQIAIIGVENYSTGLSPSYGDLTKASKGTEQASVRLLLSHDPSHWEAEVTQASLPVDLTCSGHTHGSRIKITRGNGNPIHIYRQYDGLYQKGKSYIYVNTGFGNSKRFGRRFRKREVTVIVLQKKDRTS